MTHDTTGPRYVILERLTEPGIGSRHAVAVVPGQVTTFDDQHWRAVHDGTDRTGFEAACKSAGIEAAG